VADHRARIQRAGRGLLQPGEPVLASVRAAAEGSPLGALGGLVVLIALAADQRSRAEDQGFPASMQMVLAVTDRRLVVFRKSLFPLRFRGELPLEAIQAVSVERRGMSPRLRFVLSSRAELTFTTYRLDHPDEFVRAFEQAREDRTRVVSPRSLSMAIPAAPPPPV